MNRVLVLGGTGFIGESVCERLFERSGGAGRIVVSTRRWKRADKLRLLPTIEVRQADVHDDADLSRLLPGADAVVNLVAILHGSRDAFHKVHVELPRRLAAACKLAGVKRLVHVSALGVGPNAPSDYLRSKTEGESVLQAAGLDLTLLRPSVVFGAGDSFLNLFAKLQAFAPLLPLAGSDAKFQPVWVEDVASAIVRCLDQPDSIGRVYELAGPDVYTLSELVASAGRWAGHERPQIALPDSLGRMQAGFMELLPGEPLMSRDNLKSMQQPNTATGNHPGLAELGITPTALAAIAPGYLGGKSAAGRFNRWRADIGRDN
ncbi:MAG: complex I NDUFA9 subunit family protein [Rubrivivax sp.]